MICNRCSGTGILNIDQIPKNKLSNDPYENIKWIESNSNHDVCVCDCCGDGHVWYGEPGNHYGRDDPQGYRGPYLYNGGLCECH